MDAIEISKISLNKKLIDEVRKELFDTVSEDVSRCANKQVQSSDKLREYTHFDNEAVCFTLEIEVGTRTGKPSNPKMLAQINLEKRFETRVKAFSFLSNYWCQNGAKTKIEKPMRSISPLRFIFEYQEEHIFDVPASVFQSYDENHQLTPVKNQQANFEIKIEVSDLDGDRSYGLCFNKSLRRKVKKTKKKAPSAQRKNTSKNTKKVILESLTSILSEMETREPSLCSQKLPETDDSYGASFSSKYLTTSKSTQKQSENVNRKKVSNSLKQVVPEGDFLKPAVKRERLKKKRPASISYQQMSLLGMIKSLDEISSEMESSDLNH